MTVCQTPDCPAARERDEFGRLVSVEHGGITQPVLGATGHHLLNRQQRGELDEHLKTWTRDDLRRADADLDSELTRVRRYLHALTATQNTIWDAEDAL